MSCATCGRRCFCSSAAHPLHGCFRYLRWLLLCRWLVKGPPPKGEREGKAVRLWAVVNHYAQALFGLGFVGGVVTLVTFIALPYATVRGGSTAGEVGQPTVSSLCPGLWVGLFVAGAPQRCRRCACASHEARMRCDVWAPVGAFHRVLYARTSSIAQARNSTAARRQHMRQCLRRQRARRRSHALRKLA
jgi:hypothetical protein